MRNVIVGFIIGLSVAGIASHAVGVTLESVTVRDIYRGFALCGQLSHNGSTYMERMVDDAVTAGDLLYSKRAK